MLLSAFCLLVLQSRTLVKGVADENFIKEFPGTIFAFGLGGEDIESPDSLMREDHSFSGEFGDQSTKLVDSKTAEDCVPGDEGCLTKRRRRDGKVFWLCLLILNLFFFSAEEPCSSYNDCGYGYACEGANANKRGVCRGI